MADLPAVKRKRGAARSWLSKVMKNAIVLLQKDDVLKEQLEVVYEDVKFRLNALSAVQDEIEMLLDENDIESDIEQGESYFRDANEVLAKLRHRCNHWTDNLSMTQSPSGEPVNVISPPYLGPSQGYLPKINIGKFSGEFSSWQPFFDKFSALIDNTSLPDISKFTYLQSFIEGDAEKAIEGLSLTSENYKIALDILKTRFGRKERIVYGHIQNLLAVDFQNSSKNVKQLWNAFNELQGNIRSLETLGVDGVNYGLILTPLIVSRLAPDMRLMWARQCNEKEADLDFLMTFLQSEIENRERSLSFTLPSTSQATAYDTLHRDRVRDFGRQQRHSGAGRESRGPRATTAGNFSNSGTGRESRGPRATVTGIALNNSVAGRASRGHRATDLGSSLTTPWGDSGPCAPKGNREDPVLCAFCDGEHASDRCRAVFKMDINDINVKIKEHNLCFVCLKKGHVAKKCFSNCQICKGKHNELFCKNGERTCLKSVETNNSDDQNVGAQSHVTFCQSSLSNTTTVLQTLLLKINGIDMNVLFDSGSDKSFITSTAVNRLRPPFVGRETVRMAGFGSKQPSAGKTRNVYSVNFDLSDNKTQTLLLTEVDSISAMLHKPKIPVDLLSYFSPQCRFSQDISTTSNVTIDILIGQDYYWHLIDVNETIQSQNGLVAQKTHLGLWVLSGAFKEKEQKQINSTCRQFLCLNEIPEGHFRKLWDLEYLECNHEGHQGEPIMSKVLSDFEKQIRHVEGRYEVALPWGEGRQQLLQCNAKEALSRLGSLERKLARDERLKEGYIKALQHMEATGITEEVVDEQVLGPVFYLPHRPVVKSSSSTTKIRPVFDASALGPNGVSLNNCMETGPNLLPLLSDILIRFRRNKVAFSADIEKAFLQISVRPEDRDVHRFFWKVGDRLRTMRIKRVPFGNKASPFLLNATIRHHLSRYQSESKVVKELSQNMYVDDWLSGGDSVEEVLDMMSEASKIMSDAGMKLTKWSSNSLQVAENIHLSFKDKSIDVDVFKVLGVCWVPGADALTFDCMVVSPDVLITKRVILSCIARIFDPLGLISPFVISLKILFQEVWKLGLSWDEQVPSEMGKIFSTWAKNLTILKELSFARSFVSVSWKEKKDVELHCFCDASLKAYGAVVYIKVFESDGSFSISLVMSKTRVSPLKPVTLPRLELLGAVIGAKLVNSVRQALELPKDVKYYCWTDSTVTLQWIQSDPIKWKMFVCNRVVQIQEVTAPECWAHCIGSENPADLLTRGLSTRDLVDNSLWFHGPPWLNNPGAMPKRDHPSETFISKPQCGEDSIEEEAQSTICLNKTQNSDEVLDAERWGDFSKAVRIVAWIFRFLNNTRKSRRAEVSDFLNTDELQLAKQKLLGYIQRMYFVDEIESLSKGRSVRKDSPLHKMRPFLDEKGMLRMRGRLQFSDHSFEEKHPIILPRCHLTRLMVRREHQRLKHGGVLQMMTSLRNQFWLIGLRSLAKRVKRECVHCQRHDSSPCTQVLSPLPRERLTRALPFSVTGLDYAGPVYVADQVGKKFYILIFTCGVIRAIHIELCESLSLIDFMLAFRRFVSRRGMPNKVLSDNAKTFQAAAKQIAQSYAEEGVKWAFNTPRAPWRGGIWERLVRSVKQSLKKTIGSRLLTRTELETVLIEIEFCINSRPLTYVSDDPECSGILSPSHFLLGRSDGHKPVPQSNVDDMGLELTGAFVRNSYRYANEQLNRFWRMWYEDYIRNLPHIKSSFKENSLKEGSIVMLSEDNCPRLVWPLGQILRLLPGRDGKVRTVEVKTAKGNLVRAVQKVHHLELDQVEELESKSCIDIADTNEELNRRSMRGRLIKPPYRLVL